MHTVPSQNEHTVLLACTSNRKLSIQYYTCAHTVLHLCASHRITRSQYHTFAHHVAKRAYSTTGLRTERAREHIQLHVCVSHHHMSIQYDTCAHHITVTQLTVRASNDARFVVRTKSRGSGHALSVRRCWHWPTCKRNAARFDFTREIAR